MAHTTSLIIAVLSAALLAGLADAAERDEFRLLELDGHYVKWGRPMAGTGATITYRVALKTPPASGKLNCRNTAAVDRLLERSQVTPFEFRAALDAAFRMWSSVAAVRFVPAKSGDQADIVVVAEDEPDGVAYTDVTHASAPGSQFAAATHAVICLNPDAVWTASNDASAGETYRLFYVLAHEIGHAIGLDHPNPSGALMSFEYSRTLQSLQPGDIAGAVLLYGRAKQTLISNSESR